MIQTIHFLYKENNEEEINSLLKDLKLDDLRNNKVSNLSEGEKRRLNILLALYGNKEILIFDEPLTSLDEENMRNVLNLLIKYSKTHLVILTNHEFIPEEYNLSPFTYSIKNQEIQIKSKEYTSSKTHDFKEKTFKSPLFLLFQVFCKHLLFFLTTILLLSLTFALNMTTSLYSSNNSQEVNTRLIYESLKENLEFVYIAQENLPQELIDSDNYLEVYEFRNNNWCLGNINKKGSILDGAMEGIMALKEAYFKDLNLVYGRIPQNSEEILIPLTTYKALLNTYSYNSFQDMENDTVTYQSEFSTLSFDKKICGVYENSFSILNDDRLEYFQYNEVYDAFNFYGLDFSALTLNDFNKNDSIDYLKCMTLKNLPIEYFKMIGPLSGFYKTYDPNFNFTQKLYATSTVLNNISIVTFIMLNIILYYINIKYMANDFKYVLKKFNVTRDNITSFIFNLFIMVLIPISLSLCFYFPIKSYINILTLQDYAITNTINIFITTNEFYQSIILLSLFLPILWIVIFIIKFINEKIKILKNNRV